MKITKNGIKTAAGPTEWFTGVVNIDTVAAPSDGSRLGASSVHFTPRARTAWGDHVTEEEYGAAPSIEEAGARR